MSLQMCSSHQGLGLGFFSSRLSTISGRSGRTYPNGSGPASSSFPSPTVRCGLRGAGTRKPLWRSAVMSTEAIHAVQALKIARKAEETASFSGGKLEQVFKSRIGRLIKADLVAVLAELQRQNHWDLALQLFEFMKKEDWYEPDLLLHCDMIYMAGKNKQIEVAEELFSSIRNQQGLKNPNSRAYTEMIGVYLQVDRLDKAMEIYNSMKEEESGCSPDELTFTILMKKLQKSEEHEHLVSALKKDCQQFLESPEKFLEQVDNKYVSTNKYMLHRLRVYHHHIFVLFADTAQEKTSQARLKHPWIQPEV